MPARNTARMVVRDVFGIGAAKCTFPEQSRHPLDGAFARVDRADKHLADLKSKISERECDQIQANPIEADPDNPGNLLLRPTKGVLPIDPIFGILVGECVYNLRAALDYLVYELAIVDSGHIQDGTQFPIESKKEIFTRRAKTWLKGINPTHIAEIEKLQPYNEQWTAVLRDKSNPDKHRLLTPVQGEHHIEAD